MLFDPRPKSSIEELFDREEEMKELEKLTKGPCPLILCLGIRRVGKTSLVKTFMNESGYPAIYVNASRLSEYNYSRTGLYRILSEEFTRSRGKLAKLIERLKRIKGITVGGYGIELDWRESVSISSILEELNDYAEDEGTLFLIVIDESQELRFLRGYNRMDFRGIIAYSYDNLRRVKFILTGSEVGLLYRFLELDKYESPLYGRVVEEITVDRFSEEKSVEFLESGFREAGMEVPRRVLEEVVYKLDGIPGWLSFYGYEVLRTRKLDVDQVVEKAVNLARSELRKLVRTSNNYKYLLRAVAMGYKNWKMIKSFFEMQIGRKVDNKTMGRLLRNLVDASILTKRDEEYYFLDPMYREAAKEL